jgi:hypothetical protein
LLLRARAALHQQQAAAGGCSCCARARQLVAQPWRFATPLARAPATLCRSAPLAPLALRKQGVFDANLCLECAHAQAPRLRHAGAARARASPPAGPLALNKHLLLPLPASPSLLGRSRSAAASVNMCAGLTPNLSSSVPSSRTSLAQQQPSSLRATPPPACRAQCRCRPAACAAVCLHAGLVASTPSTRDHPGQACTANPSRCAHPLLACRRRAAQR